MSSRPEHTAPPEIFYNDVEAKKYTQNSRIISIQNEMSYRAIELLNLPDDKICYILDIGCGSGLSGDCLSDEQHVWVGMDISKSMLDVAVENESDGDLFLQDIGQGMGFRPGTFDGCISISVIQWLCNADKQSHEPKKRLNRFFTTLFTAMTKGARCIFQFYPENPSQVEMIVSSAMKAGFSGGLVVDYPNSTKAKKYFLCLFAGASTVQDLPKPLEGEEGVRYSAQTIRERKSKSRKAVKDKNWVLKKKETRRRQGKPTANDSKYTARKRRPTF
ncbi:Williams Beuren syndrome chromosome region 22 protein [Boothiomyces sp. JEL0866]|nr:Williams Beuren syndrome chromosome region 22 protein [Boothiomyces sp. JEL0866]